MDETPAAAAAAPAIARRPRGRRWYHWLVIAAALLSLAAGGLVWLLDTSMGHRFVVDQIKAYRPSSGLRFSVGRIRGSLYSRARLIDVRIYDPKGLVFAAPVADLDWRPFAWFANRLQIDSLAIPNAVLSKLPETRPSAKKMPILPGFDIIVGSAKIGRLVVDRRITGTVRTGRLSVRADIRHGRALVDLDGIIGGSDRLAIKLDAEPDRDRFDIDAKAFGVAGGVIAKATGIGRVVAFDLSGDGKWSAWRGTARAQVAGAQIVDLSLENRSGHYTLGGMVTPASFTHGKLQRLTSPGVAVDAAATLADRRLQGHARLRSAALDATATGEADLADDAWRDLRIKARLLRPPALFPDMTGRNIELRAIVDGPFANARFDYRLTADRFAFGNTGFENGLAAGSGRLSRQPIVVPVAVTIERATGVGVQGAEILHRLRIDGRLNIGGHSITGTDVRIASDKLKGNGRLTIDTAERGSYQVDADLALPHYLIPTVGIVDVTSKLRVVPFPDRQGGRLTGIAAAQMARLDNSFFRSLTGGLPRLTTSLERTRDGVIHFGSLQIIAPQIRVGATGYRRRDDTLHLDGRGQQSRYGPFTIRLDGHIERPTLDVVLDRPNEAMGLSAVRTHLDPTPAGYSFRAAGGSRLGDFTADGQLLLPKGQSATVAVTTLDVAGMRAGGSLLAVEGGFDGKLAVGGRGVSGEIGFRPVNAVQRVEAHLEAADARFDDQVTLRRGRLDAVLLLDPDGTSVEATGRLGGLRRGSLSLSRLGASASLRGGAGKVAATFTGSRGRTFDIRTTADVTPDRYVVDASGSVDRREIKLLAPGVVTREGDGWHLAPTRLVFAGGEAELGGRFTSRSAAIDASVARMPLSILDIAYPGLALSGTASGKLRLAQAEGSAPTGRIEMTVRQLSRAALVLASRPIDVGIAGVLEADRAGLRAVMASGGKTIGRAQARLAPLGNGSLTARLANAALFAQLRYDGPADTLWRLTGIELFDLSGPVAIGADLGGRVNDPRIVGALRTSGARIESATTGTVLTGVQASGRFAGSRLAIDSFAADAGKGGRVTGTGSFDFAAINGFGMDLRLQASHAVMIDRDDIGAAVTGPITFRSDGSGGVISGDLRLDRSRYRLGQALAASAVPKLNLREINSPGDDDEADTAPLRPWRLDLRARAANALTVSGLGLSSEWSADLQIEGSPENPAITGRADLVRGNYEFSGREFQLDRGILRFAGEVPANPSIDIAANASSTGLNATIKVTGEAIKPEISFTSTPALPQDELLSRLLFGTSITNLSAPEALQLAAAVAALQNGSGLNPINAVRRAVGLDRLRVLPADPTVGRATSFAAGKYVTRRLYAEIVTDGQGYSATNVEFQITRWLSLLSTISTLGRQSANIRVSKDY